MICPLALLVVENVQFCYSAIRNGARRPSEGHLGQQSRRGSFSGDGCNCWLCPLPLLVLPGGAGLATPPALFFQLRRAEGGDVELLAAAGAKHPAG
jgi:hypothetical protein